MALGSLSFYACTQTKRLLGFPADSELHLAEDAEKAEGQRNKCVYMVEISPIPLIMALWTFTWCVQPGLSHLLFLLLKTSDFSSGPETHELSEVGTETRAARGLWVLFEASPAVSRRLD